MDVAPASNVVSLVPCSGGVGPPSVRRPLRVKRTPFRDPKVVLARSMTGAAVQAMAKSGLSPMQIAIGLAWHINSQVDLVMPSAESAATCKALLMYR
jgi:hypothetical protein